MVKLTVVNKVKVEDYVRILFTRPVSDYGETLIVGLRNDRKVLTDALDENQAVTVPHGRRATLVDFTFSSPALGGRDTEVTVIIRQGAVVFASVKHPNLQVSLQDLKPAQQVDVYPSANAAAARMVACHLPVLKGSTTPEVLYATASA